MCRSPDGFRICSVMAACTPTLQDMGRTLFRTGVDISGIKEGLTYARFDTKRDMIASETFYGFGCFGTCRHSAGFRWGVRHDVRKPSECIGFGWSEIEGCAAYAFTKKNSFKSSRGKP